MGKRYGRNQKRRHREEAKRLSSELANCKTAQVMASGLCDHLAKKLQSQQKQLEDIISSIRKVVRYSSCVPPETHMAETQHSRYRVQGLPLVSFDVYSHWPSTESFETIDLYRLECFIRDNRDQFTKSAHLVFSNGTESAYMISEEALRTIPTRQLVERLLPSITEDLVRHLKKQ